MAKEQSEVARRTASEPRPRAAMPATHDRSLSLYSSPTYRPDIDGLRALAVIAVILYHANIPGFRGGYVGVDVFFVISGYLITQQLMRPGAGGMREHLATFYVRRARRILPALLVMLATTTVAAWLWLLPADLVLHGKYVALNAVLLGNLAGYTDFGYFVEAAPLRPLLHLWSIGVEEQFYLLYPLCLLFVRHQWPWRLRSLLSLVAVASLVLCVHASYRMPVANFYLLPTRGWELGAGALLALGIWRAPRSSILNEWAAGVALATLLICVTLYAPVTPYPGLLTLPVCLATLLLIATGTASRGSVRQLLSVRPLVWLGLISYSLYLWHVPVLMFFRYCLLHEPRAGELALACALIVLLATASWVLIEQPLRTRRMLRSNRAFVCGASVFAVLLLGTGIVLWHSDGFPKRMPPEVERYTRKENGYAPEALRCLNRKDAKLAAGNLCRFGSTTGPKVLVWGDSHALAMFPAYEEQAARAEFSLYFAMHSACRPLLGVSQSSGALSASEACATFNRTMVQAIDRIKPDVIVLNAFWMQGGLRPVLASDPSAHGRREAFEAALKRTVERIGRPDRRICVVHDTPFFDGRVSHVLAMARLRGINVDRLRMPRSVADAQQSDIDAAIDHLAERGIITAVNPRAALCGGQLCPLEHDGWPLYVDDNHLAREGARMASPALDGCFSSRQPRIDKGK